MSTPCFKQNKDRCIIVLLLSLLSVQMNQSLFYQLIAFLFGVIVVVEAGMLLKFVNKVQEWKLRVLYIFIAVI